LDFKYAEIARANDRRIAFDFYYAEIAWGY
jgi:hypothetical protein